MSRWRVGPFGLLAALVGGILVGDHLTPSAGVAAFGISGALVLVSAVLRSSAIRAALILAVVATLGIGLTQRAHRGLFESPLSAAITARADAVVRAALVEDPDGTRFSTRALVRVDRVQVRGRPWREAGGVHALAIADDDAAPRLAVLEAGDLVTLRGWLRPLEPYDERFRWRHAVGRFDAHTLTAFEGPRSPWMRMANTVRNLVLSGTATLPPSERALVAGFLLGDTRGLPDDVLERFRAAGLSHLLAVSGANVAFTLGLIAPLLRRAPRGLRLAATLATLFVFGAMTRWEPSVLRACAMAACAVVAVHVGRPARATRVLALAVGGLLLLDPFLVHSVGFQLSCGASLGIALLAAPIASTLRGPAWFRESFATTAAAQLGVAPVLLPVFGSMPLVALPANLLAVPIAGPLTMWGLVGGVVGGSLRPVASSLVTIVQLPTRLMADAMLGIADGAARVPFAVDLPLALACAAIAALMFLARRGRMLRRDALVVPSR